MHENDLIKLCTGLTTNKPTKQTMVCVRLSCLYGALQVDPPFDLLQIFRSLALKVSLVELCQLSQKGHVYRQFEPLRQIM